VKAPSFGLILVAAFAVGTGLNGFYNGVTDLPSAPHTLGVLVGILNVLIGITGLTAAALIWRQHRLAAVMIIAWGAATVGASVLAPRAYAPETGWPTAVLGGVVTAALVVTIVLYVRWRLGLSARGESSPAS
jgi:hypothetical protein